MLTKTNLLHFVLVKYHKSFCGFYDAVGITGSTGRSTGEHLHITCRLNGKSVDPAILFEHVRRVQQECVSALAEL